MQISLATDTLHAAAAFQLTVRMCTEMGYESIPQSEAEFIAYVLFERTHMAVFVAYGEDHQPIGLVIMTKELDPYIPGYFGIMKTLYVVPEHRKSNVAESLVAALMDEAHAREYKGVQWYVYKSNAASLRFFEKRGLHPRGGEEIVEFWQPLVKLEG